LVLILILIIAVVVFLYFVSTPLPEGQGAKAEALTDKIQAAINQTAWDSTAAVSLALEEITIISGTKNAT
jgi:hypothetical protein